MIRLEGRAFRGLDTWSGAKSFEDAEIVNCRFESCHITRSAIPGQRFLIRNVRISRCVAQACSVQTTALENVVVDHLRHAGRSLPFLWCCVFSHVAFRGITASPKVNATPSPFAPAAVVQAWQEANRLYYAGVDWALDLRDAKFTALFDLPGVSVAIVLRTTETQFVLRRERVMARRTNLRPRGSISKVVLDRFVASGLPDLVVVTGRASRLFEKHLAAFRELRESGIAEQE